MAYLIACFPHAGSFLTLESQDAIRRRLVGRDRDDVVRAIELHAETSERISVRGLLDAVDAAAAERRRAEEERAAESRLRLPAPPPPPVGHRSKVVLAARGVFCLVVLRMIGRGETDADKNFHLLMSEDPQRLAEYVGDLEAECARRGKGQLGDMLGQIERARAADDQAVTP